MHGLGNDFVVIDGVRQQIHLTPTIVQQWADRHTGIGFDQLLLVEAPRDLNTDFFYRIFNADGTEVAQCGNGARCLALFLQQEKLTDKNFIKVATLAGELELTIESDQQVKVNMGVPNFVPAKIPFLVPQQQATYSLPINNETVTASVLSIGNPHCVLIVPDVVQAPVEELGSLLTKQAYFPEEANIGFMQIINPHQIKLRVYERGAGETQACGSGACAAVVAGCSLSLLASKVTVVQPGGHLEVNYPHAMGPVYLTGPAITAYKGTVLCPNSTITI